jgi:hypothetical protein
MSILNRQTTDLIVVSQTGTHSRQNIGKSTLAKEAQNIGVVAGSRGALGVHFVVRRSGAVEIGRDLTALGQHGDLTVDEVAVHIQLVGGGSTVGTVEDNFTEKQQTSLGKLLDMLWLIYPNAIVASSGDVMVAAPLAFDLSGYDHEARLAEYMARIETERERKQEKALEELDRIFGD